MNYAKIVQPDTFIGRYLASTENRETPTKYDFWCAMWALGSVLGREAYVDRPGAPIRMNWYIMLVAESGVTRKSTALRTARDIVSGVLGYNHLLEGKATPEYVFNTLVGTPHTAICVSELATFLGRDSYAVDLPALLTDLYDCPPMRRGGTVTRGERVIENAYVTFASASTPSWLRTAVNPSVIQGGFTSRCLFVHAERPKKLIAWPDDSDTNYQHVIDALIAARDSVTDINGRIQLMPNALSTFSTWYRQRDIRSVDPFISSFISREDGHLLRAAACLCINDGTLAVTTAHIRTAAKLINDVKQDGASIFVGTGMGQQIKVARGIERALAMIQEAGPVGVTRHELNKAVRYWMTSDEFNIFIAAITEEEMVTVLNSKPARGRPVTRYVRTNDISHKAKVTEIIEMMVN